MRRLTGPVNGCFDKNADATYAVEVHFSVRVFVPIAHPVQSAPVHVVFFVACGEKFLLVNLVNRTRKRGNTFS